MLDEARQGAAAVARQLGSDAAAYTRLGRLLRERPPSGVLTIARGSSSHAADFMAYLVMARLGRLVTSLPMSLITLYEPHILGQGLLSVAFSQSGQSPDLIAPVQYLRAHGSQTVAVVNDSLSPLAQAAQWVLPLHAGPETSVAATKSFIAQLVVGARLVAAWQESQPLRDALNDLPEALRRATALDWSDAIPALLTAQRLLVIGRGTGLPIAQEAALKFKETCGIQAEAFSSAEVRHGPMALISTGYPVLVFAPRGPAQAGLLALAGEMRERGATVLVAAPPDVPGMTLPLVETTAQDLDPICAIQSFYPFVEALARARGLDPDRPPHLAKVTRTR